MRRRDKDRYRWHTRFAWYPKRVGDGRIWLEWYRWRNVRPEPIDWSDPHILLRLPMPGACRWEEEFESSLGNFIRATTVLLGCPFASHSWKPVPTGATIIPFPKRKV